MRSQQTTLSRIIGAIGEEGFPATAANAVAQFMEFELAAVLLHRAQARPILMFDNFDAANGRQGVENYLAFTYRLNPMLGGPILTGGRQGGAFRARDFAIRPLRIDDPAERYLVRTPDEELGFRTVGWPERLEEIGLYFEACGGVVELGCYRWRGRTPTSRMDELEALCGPVAAAFDRHAKLSRTPGLPVAAQLLSPRERQVVELLLCGCSSVAIALRLEISRHTVKDHRKQIFRKLRISSLPELFALHRSVGAVN
jgi:DNA-binding CsgD family transcriptional regulator